MKAKIEEFEKEETKILTEKLGAETTSAVDKAAIRKVLQTRSDDLDKKEEAKKAPAKKADVKKVVATKKVAPKKVAPKKEPVKPVKKAVKKKIEAVKKDVVKKPGVIQTIFNTISKKEVTEEQIVSVLTKAFPDKQPSSMTKTVKAQIGSNKRPVRMEREKNVTFKIETKKDVKYYSL